MREQPQWLIGIDEAGRGALAGPVAVGVCCVRQGFDFSVFTVVKDSKQLSPQKREKVYEEAVALAQEGQLVYSVALISEKIIDLHGVTFAVAQGIRTGLGEIGVAPGEAEVRLDGLLKAPPEYLHQRTIVKGGVTEPIISLASILAKVTRDRRMVDEGKKYPRYGFETHKGYGTKLHYAAVQEAGLTVIHRERFCRNIATLAQ